MATDQHTFPDDATVANADQYKVYYKSESGVTGLKDYVSPGKYIKNPVDGVATSKFSDQVFKIPDGGRVMVKLGGDVAFRNGGGLYDASKIFNRAGWQNNAYFFHEGAYSDWKNLFIAAKFHIR